MKRARTKQKSARKDSFNYKNCLYALRRFPCFPARFPAPQPHVALFRPFTYYFRKIRLTYCTPRQVQIPARYRPHKYSASSAAVSLVSRFSPLTHTLIRPYRCIGRQFENGGAGPSCHQTARTTVTARFFFAIPFYFATQNYIKARPKLGFSAHSPPNKNHATQSCR